MTLCVWLVLLLRKVDMMMSKNSVKIVFKMYVSISKMNSLISSMKEMIMVMSETVKLVLTQMVK